MLIESWGCFESHQINRELVGVAAMTIPALHGAITGERKGAPSLHKRLLS